MPVIVCKIEMFDNSQSIYLVENNSTQLLGLIPNNQLGANIVDYCKAFDVTNVHLYGVADYADHYAENIRREELKYYNCQNINVEIN